MPASIFMVTIPQRIGRISKPMNEEELSNTSKIVTSDIDYGSKKVLIVDDNKLNIKVARRALNDFNFELDECYDGQECLDKIQKGDEYDLILMDIMMPNMNGETALSKLKEIPGFNIPTIALTADAISGAKEKYLEESFIIDLQLINDFYDFELSEEKEKILQLIDVHKIIYSLKFQNIKHLALRTQMIRYARKILIDMNYNKDNNDIYINSIINSNDNLSTIKINPLVNNERIR